MCGVRDNDKQRTGDKHGIEDRFRQRPFGVFGLFRHGGDGIKPEECETQNRRTCKQPGHLIGHHRQRGEQRLFIQGECGTKAETQEQRDKYQLHHNDQHIHRGDQFDPENIQHRDNHNGGDDNQLHRHRRQGFMHKNTDGDIVDNRQKQIIQQLRPADQKPGIPAEDFLDIGIRRAGQRQCAGHFTIAECGKQDGCQSNNISNR